MKVAQTFVVSDKGLSLDRVRLFNLKGNDLNVCPGIALRWERGGDQLSNVTILCVAIGTLRIYHDDGEDDAWLKMCFYFTLEFLGFLNSVCLSVLKLAPAEHATNA